MLPSHRAMPDAVEERLRLGRELADEARVVGVRHEPWLEPVARVDLLVGRVRQQLGDRRIPRRHHLARRALGSGQAAELAHRRRRRPAPSPWARPGSCGSRASPTTASRRTLRASICARSSCSSPMPMSSVWFSTLTSRSPPPSNVATIGATPARCFTRSSVWRSSDAGLAAPHRLLPARAAAIASRKRREAAVGRRVQDLRVVEHVDQRLQVAVARRHLAHQRRVDEGRRGGVERAAVGPWPWPAWPSPARRFLRSRCPRPR